MQNVKGTGDFYGREQALRKKIRNVLEDVFELYDFDEMDSAILNERELLTAKYAGGDEILREMYRLQDQGGRDLALRYDLTVPFAKVVAWNPGIELPFRRYEIGKVFRDGPVKRGRKREFLQCDADVVGIAGPEAEAELLQMAVEVFGRLEIPIALRWNNRRFLGEMLEAIGVPSGEKLSVMLTLDKLEKIGHEAVIAELADKGLGNAAAEAIGALITADHPTFEYIAMKYGVGHTEGASEVRALGELIAKLELDGICRFDPFLSRGLSFYTGTVYEIFDATGSFGSSLGGGGRYDAIIGKLVGREDIPYATAGISFGMESIMEMIGSRPIQPPLPQAVVIPIGDTIPASLKTAAELRAGGIRISVEAGGRKLKKSLAAVASRGIRYAILIGKDECEAGMVRLKDMNAMTEVVMSAAEATAAIRIAAGPDKEIAPPLSN